MSYIQPCSIYTLNLRVLSPIPLKEFVKIVTENRMDSDAPRK